MCIFLFFKRIAVKMKLLIDMTSLLAYMTMFVMECVRSL